MGGTAAVRMNSSRSFSAWPLVMLPARRNTEPPIVLPFRASLAGGCLFENVVFSKSSPVLQE
jgi:hypothetical protein